MKKYYSYFDDEEEDDFPMVCECPICGCDAYWEGSCYECSNDDCGHCFN